MADKRKIIQAKGFTLIELILVMIILTTVLAIAAPSLKGFFSSRQINNAAEQIMAMTRYARTNAIYSSSYYRLNFDLTEKEYWLTILKDSEFIRLENDLGRSFVIPSDIELDFENLTRNGNVYYLEYDPQGYSKASKIILEDDSDNIIELVCYSPSEDYILTIVDSSDSNYGN